MGNRELPCCWTPTPAEDARTQRDRERFQRLREAKQTQWRSTTRAINTWDAPGLNYWLTHSVEERKRETLGQIAVAIWGGTDD